jgi:hypothetical protein
MEKMEIGAQSKHGRYIKSECIRCPCSKRDWQAPSISMQKMGSMKYVSNLKGLKDKLPNKVVIIFLILSTIAYAIQAVGAYAAVSALPLAEAIIFMSIGILAGSLLQARFYRTELTDSKVKIGKKWISVAGAFSIVISITLVLMAYKSLTLTSVYPLTAISTIVFLSVDIVRYGKKLSASELLLLAIGVLLVSIGTFFAESHGYSFDISTLPLIIGIAVSGGLGFYGLLYDLKKHGEGLKLLSLSILDLLMGIVLLLLDYKFILSYYSLLAVAAGFVFSIAVGTEMHAMKLEKESTRKRDILTRNFINTFTYLDVVLVLVAGVLIDSYTTEGIVGGVIITIGVIIIGLVH